MVTENKKAGHVPGKWNEGVGEHVRTRSRPSLGFTLGLVKLRSLEDPQRTKKTYFFCRTGFPEMKIRSSR
jgi:hypothetical protein